MNAVARPLFAEGQILAAADLAALAAYPRGRDERHNRFVHRWGIVTGLALEAEPAIGGGMRVFLSPGLAVDGEGRELLVTERAPVDAQAFQLAIGSGIDPDQAYPVFVASQFRSAENPASGPVSPCGSGGAAAQIEEGFEIVFGLPGDETFEQVPSALSAEPTTDDATRRWLILVGFVKWDKAATAFADIDKALAALAVKHRPFIGVNAGTVAGDGARVRIQPKPALEPGDAVFQLTQDENGAAGLCFGTYKSPTEIECLLEITADGNLKAKGTLTGKQTGNTVQVQSGFASDGMILPLPPGVTEAQVTDGAALHIQITPETDPAHSPDATLDWAALVQECRVDADRRVHCRICWVTLPLGAGALQPVGQALVTGPGVVRYTVAAATVAGDEG